MKDFLTIDQLAPEEIREVHALAREIKASPEAHRSALAGKSVVLLFEKPSLRTRVSFDIGAQRLGANTMYFDHAAQRIGEREPIRDYAKNLERFVDCIVARVFDHGALEQLAGHARIPVVNALSDRAHPCQALADYLTLLERFGRLEGLRVCYVGDGNNVCRSLILGAALLGVELTVVAPKGYEPGGDVLARARELGREPVVTNDVAAAERHHAVYSDTWVSMGHAEEHATRVAAFSGFTVTGEVMRLAGKGLGGEPVFMHCLPAHRGEEVAAEVIDGPLSIVYDQAENRMHAQNALLVRLLGERP